MKEMESIVLLVTVSILCTVFAQDPTVTITNTEPMVYRGVIQVERDSDVTLDCYVENKPLGSMVRWNWIYRDSSGRKQIQKVSEDKAVEDNIRTSIEKPTQFTWRLRLKHIQVTDEGNYNCFVRTTRDTTKQANMTVLVAIPPYLDPVRTSSDQVVKESDTVDLSCNASSRPPATIQWTRLGGALLPIGKEMHFEPRMTISAIKPSDRGTYRCRAFNSIGGKVNQVIRDIKIDVRFRPQITPIHRIVEQKAGYLIELQCLVEANPYPNPEQGELVWVRKGRIMTTSSGDMKIRHTYGAFNRMIFEIILSPVGSKDFGEYKCQVRNSEGSSFETIELRESKEPMPSFKLGIITKDGQIRGSSSRPDIGAATFLTLLIAFFLHQ